MGDGVVKIGALKDNREECEAYASRFLDNRYAFDGAVLFKPTKCEIENLDLQKPRHYHILLLVMIALVTKMVDLQLILGLK